MQHGFYPDGSGTSIGSKSKELQSSLNVTFPKFDLKCSLLTRWLTSPRKFGLNLSLKKVLKVGIKVIDCFLRFFSFASRGSKACKGIEG